MTAVTSDLLQALIVAAVSAADATAVGGNWFAPRDWPTAPQEMPIGMVQSPAEHKQSLGRSGAQQFTVTATIRLVVRAWSKATAGDAGAAAVLGALGVIQRQVEIAVINSFSLTQVIQQISAIRVQNGVSADADRHMGELVIDFDLEFYQGPEDFAPIVGSPLTELAIYADLVNVFSPTGTFDPALEPFDVATPSPRTSGPDGRPEFKELIELPQD
ncbi:MAG: phage tail protein [Pseudomonadota bacterium]